MYSKAAVNMQVFLGDHDWTDNAETDSFRRSVQTVGVGGTVLTPILTDITHR